MRRRRRRRRRGGGGGGGAVVVAVRRRRQRAQYHSQDCQNHAPERHLSLSCVHPCARSARASRIRRARCGVPAAVPRTARRIVERCCSARWCRRWHEHGVASCEREGAGVSPRETVCRSFGRRHRANSCSGWDLGRRRRGRSGGRARRSAFDGSGPAARAGLLAAWPRGPGLLSGELAAAVGPLMRNAVEVDLLDLARLDAPDHEADAAGRRDHHRVEHGELELPPLRGSHVVASRSRDPPSR